MGFEEGSAWVQKPLWRFEGALYASRGYGLKEGILSEDLSEHRLLLLNATIPGIFEDMNWHVRLQAGSLFCQGSEDVVHTPEHLLKMAEADFGIIAWIKNHPALKARALREILEDVSRVYAPKKQSYFSAEASSFASEGVQALYAHLDQHVRGMPDA